MESSVVTNHFGQRCTVVASSQAYIDDRQSGSKCPLVEDMP